MSRSSQSPPREGCGEGNKKRVPQKEQDPLRELSHAPDHTRRGGLSLLAEPASSGWRIRFPTKRPHAQAKRENLPSHLDRHRTPTSPTGKFVKFHNHRFRTVGGVGVLFQLIEKNKYHKRFPPPLQNLGKRSVGCSGECVRTFPSTTITGLITLAPMAGVGNACQTGEGIMFAKNRVIPQFNFHP